MEKDLKRSIYHEKTAAPVKMSNNFIVGKDVQFEYDSTGNNHPNSAYVPHTDMTVEVEVENSEDEYPESRVIKQEANGDVIVQEISEEYPYDRYFYDKSNKKIVTNPPRNEHFDESDDSGYCCDNHHCSHHYGFHDCEDEEGNEDDEDYEYDEDEEVEGREGHHCNCDPNDPDFFKNHGPIYKKPKQQVTPPSLLLKQKRIIEEQIQTPVMGNFLWDFEFPEDIPEMIQFWIGLPYQRKREIANIDFLEVLGLVHNDPKANCSCKLCGNRQSVVQRELERLFNGYYNIRRLAVKSLDEVDLHINTINAILGIVEEERITQAEEDEEEDSKEVETQRKPDPGNEKYVDGLLSVADDIVKNNGENFINLIEKLDNHISQERIIDTNETPASGVNAGDEDDYADGEEEDEEEDEEEEEEEEDEEEGYESEDTINSDLPSRMRLEETYKMLQICSSKILRSRLHDAFQAKRAEDISKSLLAEEEKAADLKREKEEKERIRREKAKEKKRLQKLAQEEERLRLEREREEAERLLKEEQRRKAEEGRKKKEAERRKHEEELQRKQEEKRKRKEAEAEKLRKEKEEKERKRLEAKKQREQEMKLKQEQREKKEKARLTQLAQKEKERKEQLAKQEQERQEQIDHKLHREAEQDQKRMNTPTPKKVIIKKNPLHQKRSESTTPVSLVEAKLGSTLSSTSVSDGISTPKEGISAPGSTEEVTSASQSISTPIPLPCGATLNVPNSSFPPPFSSGHFSVNNGLLQNTDDLTAGGTPNAGFNSILFDSRSLSTGGMRERVDENPTVSSIWGTPSKKVDEVNGLNSEMIFPRNGSIWSSTTDVPNTRTPSVSWNNNSNSTPLKEPIASQSQHLPPGMAMDGLNLNINSSLNNMPMNMPMNASNMSNMPLNVPLDLNALNALGNVNSFSNTQGSNGMNMAALNNINNLPTNGLNSYGLDVNNLGSVQNNQMNMMRFNQSNGFNSNQMNQLNTINELNGMMSMPLDMNMNMNLTNMNGFGNMNMGGLNMNGMGNNNMNMNGMGNNNMNMNMTTNMNGMNMNGLNNMMNSNNMMNMNMDMNVALDLELAKLALDPTTTVTNTVIASVPASASQETAAPASIP